MEQTVNTFQKGLQTDIHPMVQGNDVLSDALNATFVTMNGNEIILQNDMGNRRIDNAFLPPGYEPVGIKEYGGVIYIAAYNPITNQSQLGSFPSPERKLSSADFKDGGAGDGNPDLQGSLDFSGFKKEVDNVNFLATDSILVPLTKKDSLHAGDKFVVYGGSLSKNDISNYENTTGDKVTSPKNKSYTLALGILNSQNEFVDITKSLVRWNTTNNTIMDLDDKSDLYKFNAGYFIANDSYEAEKFAETIKDKELIKNRLAIPANTYAYKLVGPLYLKATLNRIQEFNYNIYGSVTSKNNEGNITGCEIVIEGFITYNCPDNQDGGPFPNTGGEYVSYYETLISKLGWAYTFNSGTNSVEYITEDSGKILQKNENERSVYNPETNTYSAKVVKKYNISSGIDNNKLKYALGVIANFKNKYIVESLSTKGEIDLSKLGSGEIILNSWRFYNSNNSTTLVYGFEAYPKYGQSFTDLTFIFTKVGGVEEPVRTFTITENNGLKVFNGKNTININWEEFGIQPRELYKVDIKYKIKDEYPDPNASQTNGLIDLARRWFLSTPLMNDCFSSQSGSFIKDYGNPDKPISGNNMSEEAKTLEQKLKILSKVDFDIRDNSGFLDTVEDTGNWITNSDADIEITKTYTYNLSLNLNPSVRIYNEDYYPDFIKIEETSNHELNYQNSVNIFLGNAKRMSLNPGNQQVTLSTDSTGEVKKLIDKIYLTQKSNGSNPLTQNGFKDDIIKFKGEALTPNHISVNVKLKNKLKAKANSGGEIQNAFGNIDYYIKSISLDGKSQVLPYYGGFSSTYYDPGSTHRYRHVVNFFTTQSSYVGNTLTAQDLVYTKANNDGEYIGTVGEQGFNEIRTQIFFDESDDDRHWPETEEQKLSVLRAIDNISYKSAIIYYGEEKKNGKDPKVTIRPDLQAGDDDNGYQGIKHARIFVRKANGSWALFDKICEIVPDNIPINSINTRFEKVLDFLKENLFKGKSIIYCFGHDISFEKLGLYHIDNANYIYNEQIKLDIPFTIQYVLEDIEYDGVDKNIQCFNKKNGNIETPTYVIQFKNGNGTTNDKQITEFIDYPVEVECPDELQDQIYEMLKGSYNKLCVVPPYNLDIDSNGYELSTQKIYELLNGKLVSSGLKNLTVSPEFGASNYDTIVYTGDEPGIFQYPYDCELGSIRTTLSYSNLIDKVIT